VASAQGSIEPLLGCFQPSVLDALAQAARHPEIRLRDVMSALGVSLYEVEDPDLLFNVNTPDDLLQAAAMLDRRRARSTR
jgi:molybdopterin-guanine dinucleotide biosynthesis protein A